MTNMYDDDDNDGCQGYIFNCLAYGWLKMGERFDPKCEVRC
jgi:hypothetical protein